MCCGVLRGALGRAARWGYVSVNAAELAQAPSPRKPRPDPPSAREAADLLNDAWTDPEWGLLLWLTMITGLRRGELVGSARTRSRSPTSRTRPSSTAGTRS